MAQYWGRYCTQKNGIDHVVTFGDDDQCPFCKLANPTPPATSQAQASTPPQRANTIIDLSGDTPPARTSVGTKFASLGGPAAQDQRRKSILTTQQLSRARPNAGSSALATRQPQGGQRGVTARRFHMNVQIISGRFNEDREDGGKKYTKDWIKHGMHLPFNQPSSSGQFILIELQVLCGLPG